MLPRNQRQEALSRAYVRAIAARAGMVCGTTEGDYGFDMFIRSVQTDGHRYHDDGAQLDLQLKSTIQAEIRETEVAYDLEVRAYDLLRQPRVARRRILVLLALPEDEGDGWCQSEDELILRHCAYWIDLRGPRQQAPSEAYES